MPLVKRADKINETGARGVDCAAAVAVAKGKPERRDSEEDRENCNCTKNGRKRNDGTKLNGNGASS